MRFICGGLEARMMNSNHKHHSNEVMRGNLEARMMSLYDGKKRAKKGRQGRLRHNYLLFWTTLETWKQGHQTTERIDWLSLKLKYETVKRSNGNVLFIVDCPDSPG